MPHTLPFVSSAPEEARPLYLLAPEAVDDWLKAQGAPWAAWVRAHQKDGRLAAGSWLSLPGEAGIAAALLVAEAETSALQRLGASAAQRAGKHCFVLAELPDEAWLEPFARGWGLAAYRFGDFIAQAPAPLGTLVLEEGPLRSRVERELEAIFTVRDLVNLPANVLGPVELGEALVELAERFGAEATVIEGEAVLKSDYPLVEAVGRASTRPSRVATLIWGREDAPKLTLVGKGVCFDSGGLNLKPGKSMALMKKDMGGAAHALGLAQLIMASGLDLRLKVIIGAVENAVGGAAIRPGDVYRSRKGLHVEIENTDAEGRLVLADCLADADAEAPALLIDFATLTGAARVALGTELPALFSTNRALAAQAVSLGETLADPLWELPLHAPYAKDLRSDVADICHTSRHGYGGAITAALFLKRFVEQAQSWIHIDVHAWNLKSTPGKPSGGEAQGLRTLFALVREALS